MRKKTNYGMMLLALLLATALIGCSDKGTSSSNNGGNNNNSRELNSAVFNQGQTFTHTFNTAGAFRYHCGVHPSMKGTITVTAAGLATQNNVSISNSISLPSLTVNVGSTITWTNNDGVPHSVISD